MKKILVLVISLSLLCLVACGNNENNSNNSMGEISGEDMVANKVIYEDINFKVALEDNQYIIKTNSSKKWSISEYDEKVIKLESKKNQHSIKSIKEGNTTIDFILESESNIVYNLDISIDKNKNISLDVKMINN